MKSLDELIHSRLEAKLQESGLESLSGVAKARFENVLNLLKPFLKGKQQFSALHKRYLHHGAAAQCAREYLGDAERDVRRIVEAIAAKRSAEALRGRDFLGMISLLEEQGFVVVGESRAGALDALADWRTTEFGPSESLGLRMALTRLQHLLLEAALFDACGFSIDITQTASDALAPFERLVEDRLASEPPDRVTSAQGQDASKLDFLGGVLLVESEERRRLQRLYRKAAGNRHPLPDVFQEDPRAAVDLATDLLPLLEMLGELEATNHVAHLLGTSIKQDANKNIVFSERAVGSLEAVLRRHYNAPKDVSLKMMWDRAVEEGLVRRGEGSDAHVAPRVLRNRIAHASAGAPAEVDIEDALRTIEAVMASICEFCFARYTGVLLNFWPTVRKIRPTLRPIGREITQMLIQARMKPVLGKHRSNG